MDQNTNNNNPTVIVKKQDLKKTVADLKGTPANIMSVNEKKGKKIRYLSDVIDEKTSKLSEKFKLNDKEYQIVRALDENDNEIMGVYSYSDIDEDGENVIYNSSDFENTLDKPQDSKSDIEGNNKESEPYFIGFKHFIVNKKNNKARKFKTIEELAKANMGDDEVYMGVKAFKKYIDEVLFGSKKKVVDETDQQQNQNNQQPNPKITQNTEKLINLIKAKISPNIIDQLKNNQQAQKEVVMAFSELIGIPKNQLNQLINGAIQKPNMNESRIIKKRDIENHEKKS